MVTVRIEPCIIQEQRTKEKLIYITILYLRAWPSPALSGLLLDPVERNILSFVLFQWSIVVLTKPKTKPYLLQLRSQDLPPSLIQNGGAEKTGAPNEKILLLVFTRRFYFIGVLFVRCKELFLNS